MASCFTIIQREITTSGALQGKKNFRKFLLYNKRGPIEFKKRQAVNPDPDIPIDKRGVKDIGYVVDGKFMKIPEKIPELVVPDLKGFKLKPYVSYRSTEVTQSEFTARDLFEAVYAEKIKGDFKNGKLGADGESSEPSVYESMTPGEAKDLAGKTGGDIF